jgi:hypothetical protein
MDVKQLLWEGPNPITPPNMGRSVSFAWCPEDWRKFELSVRAAYPNVFFYEELKSSEESSEAEPPLTRIERLDQSRVGRVICMLFPDPEWIPKLVHLPNKWDQLSWTLDQYWSPKIWMGWPTVGPSRSWQAERWSEDGNAPVAVWPDRAIQSSFRRQFAHEVKCEAKILNLARKIGRRTVRIYWASLDHFRAGDGAVNRHLKTDLSYYVSETVLDWRRQGPMRALDLDVAKNTGVGFSRMPPEDVPEHFWGDVEKPKWVLEAIEKYRR